VFLRLVLNTGRGWAGLIAISPALRRLRRLALWGLGRCAWIPFFPGAFSGATRSVAGRCFAAFALPRGVVWRRVLAGRNLDPAALEFLQEFLDRLPIVGFAAASLARLDSFHLPFGRQVARWIFFRIGLCALGAATAGVTSRCLVARRGLVAPVGTHGAAAGGLVRGLAVVSFTGLAGWRVTARGTGRIPGGRLA
jgi:hypothetical protein